MDSGLFTRGQPGDADKRGESMVLKHAEKMAAEKEAKALEKLNALLPQLGLPAKIVALKETNWMVDEALLLLRRFLSANMEKLTPLHKKRKRLLAAAASGRGGAGDGGADGSSSSSSSGSSSSSSGDESASGSGSEEEGGRKEAAKVSKSEGRGSKRQREVDGEEGVEGGKRSSRKKRKRSRKEKKGKKDKKDRKDKKRKDKKKKKRKDEEERSGPGAAVEYGKYGILRETDFFQKRGEFQLWALEVKKCAVENMPRFEEKELFKEYMEDYNTGTLPHRKYYDMEAYERYTAAKAAKKNAQLSEKERAAERAAFNDEAELARQRAAEREAAAAERLRVAYKEIQQGGKAQDMRQQELLRMQMTLAYKTGDMAKAQKLMERLAPDDKKKDEPPRVGVVTAPPGK